MIPTPRHAQMAAALAAMGFERVDSPPVPVETLSVGPDLFKSSTHRPSMGTLVSITALDSSRHRVEEAFGQALQEMDRVVHILSRYEDDSAVSSLNAQGALAGAPPELTRVMEEALRFYAITNGAFDVTVKPLVDLFGRAAFAYPLPGPEVADTLHLVDGGSVALSHRSVRLEKTGMGVTLDGIAKGYVVDRMAQVLSGEGLSDWLINAGGDIRSSGVREDGRPWSVGVQDPEKGGALPDVIELSGGAVATSGSYEVYFDRERTSHHIVSARTGRSPTLCQSASVVAPTTLAADALATTLFVMGPEQGISLIDTLPQCACLIVDAQGRHRRSTRWRSTIPRTRKARQT